MKIKGILVLFVNLLFIVTSYTQGWEKPFYLNGDTLLKAKSICNTIDEGYLLASQSYDLASGASRTQLIKTDVNGDLQWQQQYDFLPTIAAVQQTTDKGYIVVGTDVPNLGAVSYSSYMYLVKTDFKGDTSWIKKFGVPNKHSIVVDVQETTDGYIMTGHSNGYGGGNYNPFLIKTDLSGNTLWSKQYLTPNPIYSYVRSLTQTLDGGYILVGNIKDTIGAPLDGYVIKTNASGDTLWTQRYDVGLVDYFNDVEQTSDGGYVYVGGTNGLGAGGLDIYVVKTNSNGDTLWTNTYGGSNTENAHSIKETADGGYFITGVTNSFGQPFYVSYILKLDAAGLVEWTNTFGTMKSDAAQGILSTNGYAFIAYDQPDVGTTAKGIHLIKTDLLGQTRTNYIRGNVFDDANYNCVKDTGEQNTAAILIEAIGQDTIYATTDSLGNYSILVDTGNYVLRIYSSIYAQPCNNSIALTVTNLSAVDTVNFALQAQTACALMQVDLAAPLLTKDGHESNYVINYCNKGTISAHNVSVKLILDKDLNVLSTSIPIGSQHNDTLIFNLGTVASNECGRFTVEVDVDPNAILGQTHCSEAYIYPDSICLSSNWTGPIIKAKATCLGDSVQFKLYNIGLSNFNAQTYSIFEDYFIMSIVNTGVINTSDSLTVTIPADTGKTYRIEIAQAPNYPPILGDSIATAVIEGCNPHPDGSFNTGYVTQFSNGNSSPFAAIDCQENVEYYEPNEKKAQPKGYGNQHYINKNTAIDYKIRVQNRAIDTVSSVIIRDTISPYLDLKTLEMGASSHPYSWRIYGNRILEITYDDVMLPDSLTDPVASNLFVRYRVVQKVGNPLGAVIYNSADIYFDYDIPIVSNETYHMIWENFVPIDVSIGAIMKKEVEVKVYPNPFVYTTTIEVTGEDYEELSMTIFDLTGRVVAEVQSSHNNSIQLERGSLSSGAYWYQLKGNHEIINTGKIMVQ